MLIGFVAYHHESEEDMYFVDQICVRAKFRRTGIGSQLMASVPCPTLLIANADPEGKALKFYSRLGFKVFTGKSSYEPGPSENIFLRRTQIGTRMGSVESSEAREWSSFTRVERDEVLDLAKLCSPMSRRRFMDLFDAGTVHVVRAVRVE